MSDNPDELHVLLTAPNGIAAYHVNAAKIYNSLAIGTDVSLPYLLFGEDKVNILRSKLENLQLLIIDEISVGGHKLFTCIHGRLHQIKQTGDYSTFGKVSVIGVGEFY